MNIKSLALALILASTPLVTAEAPAQTSSKKKTVLAALTVVAGVGLVIAALSSRMNNYRATPINPPTRQNLNQGGQNRWGTDLTHFRYNTSYGLYDVPQLHTPNPHLQPDEQWVENLDPYTPRGQ